MTVYVITRGCYSDYGICAVSLDKKKAEKLAKMYSNSYDTARVEEWETDTVTDINALNGRYPYSVSFYKDNRPYAYKHSYEYEQFREGVAKADTKWMEFTVNVYAPDEATAIKIASDKRAKYLAEKEGIA